MSRIISVDLARLLAGAGAILTFIGAYSPWVITFALFTSIPVRGINTDYGRIVPLIPLMVMALLAWRWYGGHRRWIHLAIIALGILTMVLALAYAVQVKRNLARARESIARSGQIPGAVNVRFDIGMYLTVAGGAAMVAGGVFGIRGDRSPQEWRASE